MKSHIPPLRHAVSGGLAPPLVTTDIFRTLSNKLPITNQMSGSKDNVIFALKVGTNEKQRGSRRWHMI
jgi:hypothetical protein